MSNGDILDREDTLYESKARELLLAGRNWLRHGKTTSAGKIDEMLFEWVSVDDLSKGCLAPVERVYAHLNHLRKEHKLLLEKKNGKFRYDLEGLKGKRKAGKKPTKKVTQH